MKMVFIVSNVAVHDEVMEMLQQHGAETQKGTKSEKYHMALGENMDGSLTILGQNQKVVQIPLEICKPFIGRRILRRVTNTINVG